MSRPQNLERVAEAAALGVLSLGLIGGAAPDVEPVLRLRAFAVDKAAAGSSQTSTLDIVIERWSTDTERQKIIDTLTERGPETLREAAEGIKPRAGYISQDGGIGWDVKYARRQAAPGGGQRIVFATDRPMAFWELAQNTRSREYEYMVGEVRLRPDGKGEGKLATAAKVDFDKASGRFEIENYNIEPVRLAQVVVVEGRSASR
jgi:hypothetical protein